MHASLQVVGTVIFQLIAQVNMFYLFHKEKEFQVCYYTSCCGMYVYVNLERQE